MVLSIKYGDFGEILQKKWKKTEKSLEILFLYAICK